MTTSTDGRGDFHIEGADGTAFVRAPSYRAEEVDLTVLPSASILVRLQPFTPKALYLSAYGIGSRVLRDSVLQLIHDAKLNALVIDLKGDRGLIPYPSAIDFAKADGARQMTSIPDLGALIRMLHSQGIYAIARIVTFKDPPLAAFRPDLAVHRIDGSVYRDRQGLSWTDPFQPEVGAYNIGVAVEAAQAGFDEIQFDYLRFPDAAELLRFAGPSNEASRISAIAGFLASARQNLRPYNVYLAADVFGYVCWNHNDTGIGQRLEEVAANVDYIAPMLYPSGFQFGIPGYSNPVQHPYEIVLHSLEQARLRLNIQPNRFRPWLQAFKDYAFDHRAFGAAEVAAQIKAATDFGADGWMLWNPRNDYNGEGLASTETGSLDAAMASAPLPLSACF